MTLLAVEQAELFTGMQKDINMAADFNKPVTTDTYVNVLSEIRDNATALAVALDPAVVTPSNIPTNSVRWTSASNKWQKWNGSSWGDLSSAYVFTGVSCTTLTASGNATLSGITTFAAGSAAAPSIVYSTDTVTGRYSSAAVAEGFSLNGLLHNYIASNGAVVFPATNVLSLGTTAAIENHSQSTTNTVAAAGVTYGILFNYKSVATNLVSAYTNQLNQFTFEGPTGVVGNIIGSNSVPFIGAGNLSTITNLSSYQASCGTVLGGSATNYNGFVAQDVSVGTNNYGFKGNLTAGTGKWNVYMPGTAINYLAGALLIGSTTDDGTNKLQVTGGAYFSGNIFRGQSAPAAKTTVVTLTSSELLGKIITGTPSAGNTAYTLPLGTDLETALGGSPATNTSFDWSLINLATGSNTITLTANTGHTIVGNGLINISSSALWRTRRSAANTFITYRIS